MAERYVLDQPKPALVEYRLCGFYIDYDNPANSDLARYMIRAVYVSNTGEMAQAVYSGATAKALIEALNVADLSAKSLLRRVNEKVAADNKLGEGTASSM